MPPPDERIALRFAARGMFAVVGVLAAIPAYLTLALAWRPLAARLACALLVAAACTRLIRSARGSIEGAGASALDVAAPRAQPPELDERFLRLRDELRFGTRSRQYFETILWPDLGRLGGAGLSLPPERRGIRRDGPSLRDLERLVAAIEARA
jgi:hypothetical protein